MKKLFKMWILNWILRDIVHQEDVPHKDNITDLYGSIVTATRNQFTDNKKENLDNFLHECFEDSLEKY